MSKVTQIIQKYKPATTLVKAINFSGREVQEVTALSLTNIYVIVKELKTALTNNILTPAEVIEANFHLQVYAQLQNLFTMPKY